MDWEDAVDWVEPSNMTQSDFIMLVEKRMKELTEDKNTAKQDAIFIYLALHHILTRSDDFEERIFDLEEQMSSLWKELSG